MQDPHGGHDQHEHPHGGDGSNNGKTAGFADGKKAGSLPAATATPPCPAAPTGAAHADGYAPAYEAAWPIGYAEGYKETHTAKPA